MSDFGREQGELLHQFLRSRRSVRQFSEKTIPKETLERILESGIWAPNAHNRQAWRFVRIHSKSAREKLIRALGAKFKETLIKEGQDQTEAANQAKKSNQKILEAPEAILLCLDLSRIEHRKDAEREKGEIKIAEQSLALAGGQILLAAHAENVAGVWVCAPLFAAKEVQAALDLDGQILPQAVLLLGYPDGELPSKARRALTEVFVER